MEKNKNNIVLIGMPAVGKSTIGILLAKKIGFDFLDTDIIIQTCEGTTLSCIIEKTGVAEFLNIEEKHCLSINCKNKVIATGGSVVYSRKAMAHLCENGRIIYLETDLAPLKKRLSALDSRGVIRGPGQNIDSLYFERVPLYRQYADITIACNGLTPDQVLTKISKELLKKEAGR